MNLGLPSGQYPAIRSYVSRQSRITAAQQRALKELWPDYGLTLAQGMLNPVKVFGRQAPLIVEIGFGMGDSLVTQAQANPTNDFIGIEVHKPGIGHLLHQIQQANLSNIRIYQADAVEVLEHCISNESLAKVQIFFPDPWPKKRHHKRRLVQAEFVNRVLRKLQPGGLLHLATDWQDYGEHMSALLTANQQLVNLAGIDDHSASNRPMTKFEQRGKKLGHGIWDLIFAKR
jgi:tRNA (guanine-N7-)-methyltransferase